MDALCLSLNGIFYSLTPEEIYEEFSTYTATRNKDARLMILKVVKSYFEFLATQEEHAKQLPSFLKLFGSLLNTYYEDPDIEICRITNDTVLYIIDNLTDEKNHEILKKVIDPTKIKARPVVNRSLAPNKQSRESLPDATVQGKVSPPKINSSAAKHRSLMSQSKNRRLGKTAEKGQADSLNYCFRPFEMSDEDVFTIVTKLVESEIISEIKAGSDKSKAEAIARFNQEIEKIDPTKFDLKTVHAIFTFLRTELKDYKENNIIIIKEVFETFSILVAKLEKFDTLFYEFSLLLAKKITEPKFRPQIYKIFSACSEKLEFHKVLYILLLQHDAFVNQNNLNELLPLLTESLNFCKGIIFQEVRRFLIPGLNSANQPLRTSAIAYLKRLAPFLVEEQLKDILRVINNPTLAKNLEGECTPLLMPCRSKVNPFKIEVEESNDIKEKPALAKKPKSPKKVSDASKDPRKMSEERVNRANGNQLSAVQEAASLLNRPDWKARKEALENYFNILEKTSQAFIPAAMSETFSHLNEKLHDAHPSVVLAALSGLKLILAKRFVNFRPHYQILLQSLLEKLTDKNVN